MLKQINSKRRHSEVTDLVSTGVEEVPQTDDVAVVQLSHDLQLTVLENKRKTVTSMCDFGKSHTEIMITAALFKI